jgi:hypothetical protein
MSTNQNQALGIELRVSKKSCSIGEPIDATLILNNQSNTALTINKRMAINPWWMRELWEVKFDIVFPPGERITATTLINRKEPDKEDFITLPPGEEIERTYILTDYYWMELPGIYEIRVIYHNSDDGRRFGLSAWMGEVTSAPVHLRITE